MQNIPSETVEQYRASIKALEDQIEQMDELVARILSGLKGQGSFGLDELSRMILQIRTQ